MSAGASDNIHTRSMGIPTISIDGMFDDIDDGRAHGRDERIGVQAFNQELDFTYALMRSFSQRSKPPAKQAITAAVRPAGAAPA